MTIRVKPLLSVVAICAALGFFLPACGDDSGKDDNQSDTTMDMTTTPDGTMDTTQDTVDPNQGFTDCGNFPDEMPKECQPGQYCADAIFSDCQSGCLSNDNCASDQTCVKEGGENVGSCQNVVMDPCEGVMCDAGEVCQNGSCVTADPCAGVTCDAGETCVNGSCVAGDPCAGVTCDAGETCENGTCVADDPCAGVTCDAGEVCENGTCVSTADCTPNLSAQDGCPDSSICIFLDEVNTGCQTFPACDNGTCDPGITGAVCSSEIVPEKDPQCLAGGCLEDSHCPETAFCIYEPIDVVGFCDSGEFGADCLSNDDCISSVCDIPFPGELGICE